MGPVLSSVWPQASPPSSEAARRRELVVRAVAAGGRTEARRWLLSRLDEPGLSRHDLRLVVSGLAPTSWARQPATVPASVLAGRLVAEAARVRSALVGLQLLRSAARAHAASPESARDLEIAESAFRDEVEEARHHVEVLFGASACPNGTAWYLRALSDDEPPLRAAAIELTETTLGRRRGEMTLAVLDPTLDDDTRVRALEASGVRAPLHVADPLSWFADVATDRDGAWDSSWLRACVLRCLPCLSSDHAVRSAHALSGDADPVVAETAAWVIRTSGAPGARSVPRVLGAGEAR